jgi:hypothetical protein
LLKDLLLTLGRIFVHRRIRLQITLVKGHQIVLSRYVLFQERIL